LLLHYRRPAGARATLLSFPTLAAGAATAVIAAILPFTIDDATTGTPLGIGSGGVFAAVSGTIVVTLVLLPPARAHHLAILVLQFSVFAPQQLMSVATALVCHVTALILDTQVVDAQLLVAALPAGSFTPVIAAILALAIGHAVGQAGQRMNPVRILAAVGATIVVVVLRLPAARAVLGAGLRHQAATFAVVQHLPVTATFPGNPLTLIFLTEAVLAEFTRPALTAGAAAPVVTTLHILAVGGARALGATLLALLHTLAVPLVILAKRVHGEDALLARTSPTTRFTTYRAPARNVFAADAARAVQPFHAVATTTAATITAAFLVGTRRSAALPAVCANSPLAAALSAVAATSVSATFLSLAERLAQFRTIHGVDPVRVRSTLSLAGVIPLLRVPAASRLVRTIHLLQLIALTVLHHLARTAPFPRNPLAAALTGTLLGKTVDAQHAYIVAAIPVVEALGVTVAVSGLGLPAT